MRLIRRSTPFHPLPARRPRQNQYRKCEDPGSRSGSRIVGHGIQHCIVHLLYPLYPFRGAEQHSFEEDRAEHMAEQYHGVLAYVRSSQMAIACSNIAKVSQTWAKDLSRTFMVLLQ